MKNFSEKKTLEIFRHNASPGVCEGKVHPLAGDPSKTAPPPFVSLASHVVAPVPQTPQAHRGAYNGDGGGALANVLNTCSQISLTANVRPWIYSCFLPGTTFCCHCHCRRCRCCHCGCHCRSCLQALPEGRNQEHIPLPLCNL